MSNFQLSEQEIVNLLPFIPLGQYSFFSCQPTSTTPDEAFFRDINGNVRCVGPYTSVLEIQRVAALKCLEILEEEKVDMAFIVRHALNMEDVEDALHLIRNVIFKGSFEKEGLSPNTTARTLQRVRVALGIEPANYTRVYGGAR